MSHPNTIVLIKLHTKAIENGWTERYPKVCFCHEVAKRANELGNEYPSDNAILIANKMLENQKRWKKKNESD